MGQSKMKEKKCGSASTATTTTHVSIHGSAPAISDKASIGSTAVAASLSDGSITAYAMAEGDIQSSPITLLVSPSGAKKNEQKSPLLKLPTEIKMKIWNLVVTVEDPITPIQLTSKANKFLWSTSQIITSTKDNRMTEKNVISAVAPLDVVALSAVCKEVYKDVALTHLFYKKNIFDFTPRHARIINTYLVAITEPRRHAICSIKYRWNIGTEYYSPKDADEELMMIASCKGLQSLELNFSSEAPSIYHNSFKSDTSRITGMKYAGAAVQGLKALAFNIPYSSNYRFYGDKKLKKAMIKDFSDVLAEPLNVARTGKYNDSLFRAIQEKVNLDVHGEGRLLKDKKPGLISSRTRGQVLKAENLSAEGILPARETPKYDLNGYLTWFIESIENCRQVLSDDGTIGVQFQIKCQNHDGEWHRRALETYTFWEDVSVLNSDRAYYLIATFYEKHIDMPGKQEVLDYWGTHVNDDENFATPLSKRYWKRIEVAINREAREAAKASKAATTADKITKATKVAKSIKKAA